MLDFFVRDFRNAPLWQKVLLLGLAAILFFHFFIYSSLMMFSIKINKLDKKRDNLFRQLQTQKYLLEDKKIIENNFVIIENNMQKELHTKTQIYIFLQNIMKNKARKLINLEIEERKLDVSLNFFSVLIKIKAVVLPEEFASIIENIFKLPYIQLKSLEYANNYLYMELSFLLTKNSSLLKVKNKTVKKKTLKNIKTITSINKRNVLQGIYKENQQVKVIVNNQLYNVGDKCGKYTIMNAGDNKVVFKSKDKEIKLKIGQYF